MLALPALLKHKFTVVALFGIALLNALPFLAYDVGGDKLVHYAFLQCFGDAFWRGELYPRWCMEANAGLGAPFFYFYFPGAYWITSLFYPLKNAGISLLDILRLSVLLATFITAVTAYVWLRLRAERKVALLLTAVFLFAPYRMELLVHRAAFAELWCMAFLPLMMLAAERMLQRVQNWPTLAGATALCLFMHPPATIMAGLLMGIYLILMAEDKKTIIVAGTKAALLAATMAAVYVLPALFYHAYTALPNAEDVFNGWPNRVITLQDVSGEELGKLKFMAMLACALGWVITVVMFAVLWLRYRKPMLREHQKEFIVWGVLIGLIAFIVLPSFAPLLEILPQVKAFIFPWRAQVMLPFALTLLMAYWLHYKPNAGKTMLFDVGMFVGLLLLLGQMMAQQFDYTQGRAFYDKVIDARIMNSYEHSTLWTEREKRSREFIFDIIERNEKGKPLVEVVKGNAKVTAIEVAPNRITFHAEVTSPQATIRLYHRYFPTWEAADATLTPEEKTGLMRMELPAGKRDVLLNHSVYGTVAPSWVRLSPWFSLLGVALFWWCRKQSALTR